MDLNDLLSEDESVDYSTPCQPLQPTVQVQNQIHQNTGFLTIPVSVNPETVTDSSLDSSSIEVLQPDTGLQIPLPINPPQRQPPTNPPTPRTNVAVPHNDNLITDDEETGDQVVPPAVGAQTSEQGRCEDIISHPSETHKTIQSEIELTVNDLEMSNQRLTDKCAEIDLQLSTHVDCVRVSRLIHRSPLRPSHPDRPAVRQIAICLIFMSTLYKVSQDPSCQLVN